MALSRPFFTGFEDFFGVRDPITDIVAMPVLSGIERDPFMVLQRSSPGFEIHQNDNAWQICIDVPGVKSSDMDVKLEENGRLLHLSGGRKVVKENQVTETRFDKRFTIGNDIDTTKITANLADGVLTVTAPKKPKQQPKTNSIPIIEGPPAVQTIEDKKE